MEIKVKPAQTLAAEPFRVTANIASIRFSGDGQSVFLAHENEAIVSVLDVKSGTVKARLPLLVQGSGLSPDGQILAGIQEVSTPGMQERIFGVWQWPNRELLWKNKDVALPDEIAFSPDGEKLAIAGSCAAPPFQMRIWVFQAKTGQELWRADIANPEHEGWTKGLVWLGNNRLLASYDHLELGQYLFAAEDGRRIEDHSALENVSGEALIAAAKSSTLVAWNELGFEVFHYDENGNLESLFNDRTDDPYKRPFNSVSLSPDGKLLLVTNHLESVVYDVASKEKVRTVEGEGDESQFSTDGSTVAIASHSKVKFYSTANWESAFPERAGHEHSICDLEFSPDGKLLASSDGNEILLWKIDNGSVVGRIRQPDSERSLCAMVFHANEPLLIAGDGGGVYWWDYSLLPPTAAGLPLDAAEPANKRLWHWSPAPEVHSHCLALDGVNRRLLIGLNKTFNLVELAQYLHQTPLGVRALKVEGKNEFDWFEEAALHSDGQYLSVATYTELRTYLLADEKLIASHPVESERGHRKFSPSGCLYAANSRNVNGEVITIDTLTGKVVGHFKIEPPEAKGEMSFECKAWSDDGKYLASSAYRYRDAWSGFYVWEIATGKLVEERQTARGRISAIAFRPKINQQATSSADGAIELWSMEE